MSSPDLVLQHPLHTSILQYYDGRASTYDSESSGFHPRFAADFINWVDPLIKDELRHPIKMLDLCCGTGLVTFAAMNRFGSEGVMVDGVDISLRSLEIAKGKLKRGQEKTVKFMEGSAVGLDGLGLQKGTYGLVTCCSAFVLLPGEREAIVKEWASYLRPGGVLIFDVPHPNGMINISQVLERYKIPTIDRNWIKSEDSVREVINRAGLECSDVFASEAYATREYALDQADVIWEKLTGNPMSGVKELTEEEIKGAKERFGEMMKQIAGENGVVKDESRLLVGIGIKRAVST